MGRSHSAVEAGGERGPLPEAAIRRPVILLGPPRSGTTLLYATLARSSQLWSIGGESHEVFEGPFRPERRGWESNAVGAEALDDEIAARLRSEFVRRARPGVYWRVCTSGSPEEQLPSAPAPRALRLLEKTPANCLRIPMLRRLFPDASFVFLRRDGRDSVSSLIEGWRAAGAYESYALPDRLAIEGYAGERWCFLLPPGWRELRARSLEEVCAAQWRAAVEAVLAELPALRAEERVFELCYEELVERPQAVIRALCAFLKLPWEAGLLPDGDRLPPVGGVSSPRVNEWRRQRGLMARILPLIADCQRALGYSCAA